MSAGQPQPLQSTRNVTQYLRRDVLRVGGMGLLGLTLPRLLSAEAARRPEAPPVRAKSVIFLFQFGGPSHIDTFDMKPSAPDGIRSNFAPISTAVPGVPVCEHLPNMARVLDRVAQIRTVHHPMKHHNSAGYYALSGMAPPFDDQRLKELPELFPAYGSVVDKLAPSTSGMPTFVAYPYVIADGSITPAQHATFLGKKHDPLLITGDPNAPDFRLSELALPADVSPDRLADRRELQRLIDSQLRLMDSSPQARGLNEYYEKALGMMSSRDLHTAFDLSREPDSVRERYGRTTYGQGCLLARRLVEAGVRFVNVYFSRNIGGRSTTDGGWDTHGFDNSRMYNILPKYHLPVTDRALPALLLDLEERGLLDETLVLWMGEFGRTPRINANSSRDHWPQCYTVLLAGGGVKGGAVYGASDAYASFPERDPVTPEDLAATMYTLLGIDPQTHIHDLLGRPHPISPGRPVTGIIA